MPEDWEKYAVKPTTKKDSTDWSQFEVKKNPTSPVVKTGIGQSFPGSGVFQSGANTSSPIVTQKPKPQPYVKPAKKPKTLPEAVYDDSNYLGAVWNQIANSGSDFIGGMVRLAAKSNPMGNPIMAATADQLGYRSEVVTGNILRTESSSAQNEERLQQGFDISNGISTDDAKALPLMVTRFLGDAGLAMTTGGASFLAQAYNTGLKEYDKATKDQPVDQNTREIFGVAYAGINGVLDKLSLGLITKSPTVAKGIKKTILGLAIKELAKVEGKVTSEIIEETVNRVAKQSFNKFKNAGAKALTSAGIEAGTESGQGGLSDGLKLLTNKLSDREIFNKEEVVEGFLARRINDAAGGGILGGMMGGAVALASSKSIVAKRVAESTTPEQLDLLKNEIAAEVEAGTMDADRAEALIVVVNKYAGAKQKLPADLSTKQTEIALDHIVERDAVAEAIKQKTEQAAKSDEALAPQTQQELDLLEAKRQSLNDNIVEVTTEEKFTYTVDPESGKFFKKLGEDGEPQEITPAQYKLEKQVAPKVEEVPVAEQVEPEATPEPTFEQSEEIPSQEVNLDSTPQEEILLDGEQVTAEPTSIDTAVEPDQGTGAVSEIANNPNVSEIGSEAVNPVLEKAETDLAALKQVENKTAKYEGSVKRLTEAKNAGTITESEYNDLLNRFDDVMADAMPAKTGKVQEISAEDAGLEIDGEVKKPSADKLAEIKARREAAYKRVRAKGAQANSMFNPDVIADLVEIGATYIEEGVVRFSDFAKRLQDEYGKEIPTSVMKEVYEGAAAKNGLGIRKFTKSIQDSELSEEIKDAVTSSDYRTYTKQKLDEIENKVEELSEVDRIAAVSDMSTLLSQMSDTDTNFGVIAGISLINQYDSEGRTEDADRIIELLSKSSTVLGQTLRQFGQLKKSTAIAFTRFIEKQIGEKGKKLTDVQKKRIAELFNAQKEMFEQHERLMEEHLDKMTEQSRINHWAGVGAYNIATRELENYIEELLPRELANTLATVLKLNLLTLKSLIANPIYNVMFAPVRFAKGEIANAVDKSISLIAGTPRTKISSLSGDAISIGASSVIRGSKNAWEKMMRGSSGGDMAKLDIDRRLRPQKAWERFWSKDDEFKNRKLSEKMSDFVEGTFGWTANANGRLLPFGDDPVFEMAKNHRLLELAKTKGFKGDDIERFMIKPDDASLKSATEYGRSATFQDSNVLSSGAIAGLKALEEHFTKIHPFAGGAIKVLGAASFPFIKTPASVAIKIVNYAAPIIPASRAMIETSKAIKATKAYKLNPTDFNRDNVAKHQRLLSEATADFAISIALVSIARIVVANGLISGSAPEEKERKAERDFMYATLNPFSLNVSGLARLLSGGDPSFNQGDKQIAYGVLGVLGAIFGIVNDTKGKDLREMARKAKQKGLSGKPYFPEADDTDWTKWGGGMLGDAAATLPASVKFLTEQSFLQGVESVMAAISKGEYERWSTQLFRTLLSIPVPNSFIQLNRVWRENMRDPYAESQLETMGNIVEERMRVGDGGDLPVRIDIWGEKVKQTPESANKFLFQVIDPFRTQSIMNDPTTLKVFDIFRKTQDAGAIPPAVDRYIVVNHEKRRLNKEQYQQLLELVGKSRKSAVDVILKDYNPKKVDKLELQITRLKSAYQYGLKVGRGQFIEKNKDFLK